MFKNFFADESGQGMVEYGLIIALIAVVVIVALRTLGTSTFSIFDKAAKTLKDPTLETEGGAGGEGE